MFENSLTLLLNTSIETSIFAESWKLARVIPIFKDGDRADKSNYRPISVSPVIARLFEKLVANQLYQHVIDNGLLSPAQSAYRHFHSTVTHLLKNTNDWYSGLDTGKLVGLAFIGLEKKHLILLTMVSFLLSFHSLSFKYIFTGIHSPFIKIPNFLPNPSTFLNFSDFEPRIILK